MTNSAEQQPIIDGVPNFAPKDAENVDATVSAEVQHAGAAGVEAAGVEYAPLDLPEPHPYAQLLNPGPEQAPAPAAQQGNNLSETDRQQVREQVNKNITLTQMYGPSHFNVPKN
jgi:hypothetical protein